jgi:hypothetical protein
LMRATLCPAVCVNEPKRRIERVRAKRDNQFATHVHYPQMPTMPNYAKHGVPMSYSVGL